MDGMHSLNNKHITVYKMNSVRYIMAPSIAYLMPASPYTTRVINMTKETE